MQNDSQIIFGAYKRTTERLTGFFEIPRLWSCFERYNRMLSSFQAFPSVF